MKHIRIVSIVTAVFGLICAARPAMAFEEGACRDDVKKLCGDVKPGNGSVRDCMKAHEADLSAGCKQNIAEGKAKMEEKMKAIKAACQADLKKYCANVTPGEGREFACLRSYEDKISASCKAQLPKRGMHKMHHDDKDDQNSGGGEPPAK